MRRAARLDLGDAAVVVDLGCGSGDGLAALAGARPINGTGLDLSVAAIEQAAKRFPALAWVVANADRRLPILDGSVDLVLSLHARRNPPECARVLKPSGFLLVAIPAADDLIELRAVVQGEGIARDRTAALLTEHAALFTPLERTPVREQRRLGARRCSICCAGPTGPSAGAPPIALRRSTTRRHAGVRDLAFCAALTRRGLRTPSRDRTPNVDRPTRATLCRRAHRSERRRHRLTSRAVLFDARLQDRSSDSARASARPRRRSCPCAR